MYQHIQPEALDIQLDTSEQRFYFSVKATKDAQLEYNLHTDKKRNVMELTRIHVPEILNDTDLKDVMTMEAIKHADKNGYLIKATDPYVKSWMNRHPEFNYLDVKRGKKKKKK